MPFEGLGADYTAGAEKASKTFQTTLCTRAARETRNKHLIGLRPE